MSGAVFGALSIVVKDLSSRRPQPSPLSLVFASPVRRPRRIETDPDERSIKVGMGHSRRICPSPAPLL